MSQEKKKLFVSFSVLVHQMEQGKIAQHDLDEGLFYFGCTREGITEKEVYEILLPLFDDEGLAKRTAREIYSVIEGAILRAMLSGRILFKPPGGYNTFDQLNGLLALNGYEPLLGWEQYKYYNLRAIEILAEKQNSPLIVVRSSQRSY